MNFFAWGRPRNNEFAWTQGADSTIVHQKPIGAGGFGQVHEVRHAFLIFEYGFNLQMRRIKGTQEVMILDSYG